VLRRRVGGDRGPHPVASDPQSPVNDLGRQPSARWSRQLSPFLHRQLLPSLCSARMSRQERRGNDSADAPWISVQPSLTVGRFESLRGYDASTPRSRRRWWICEAQPRASRYPDKAVSAHTWPCRLPWHLRLAPLDSRTDNRRSPDEAAGPLGMTQINTADDGKLSMADENGRQA